MSSSMPWLVNYPKEVSASYEYPKHNLAKFLVDSAQQYPKSTAIYFMGKKLTYEQVLAASYQFANVLKGLGVEKGDRVAIMLPNCPQVVIAFYGTLLLGGIAVMTNPLYMEKELKHQLNDSGAKVIITLDLLFNRINKVMPETELNHLIITSIKDYLPFPKNLLYPIKMKQEGHSLGVPYSDVIHSFVKLMSSASKTPIYEDVDAENDLALLQYTGGTTGVSKGCMLTHYNLVSNTIQANKWFYKEEAGKERYLIAIPCFHVFGLTVGMLKCTSNAGMLILVPKFDATLILETITKMKATIFPGAPTMYIGLINHPRIKEFDLSSIKACISGSAPLPLEVQERFEELTGGRLCEGYGLSEASPCTHCNNIWEVRKIGTIGVPFPDTITRILDTQTMEEMPPGEIGEMAIRGPQVMKGYWNRPEDTAKTIVNGWLLTGDMARMDEDGFFSIVDRKKDMIIVSGFNVYPRDVEEVLFEHPAIQECSVAGVPDEYRGETVKAFIVLKAGTKVTEQELDVWCRERLAAYKIPRKYEFRDSLPKTIIGKVLRRKLLEEEAAVAAGSTKE